MKNKVEKDQTNGHSKTVDFFNELDRENLNTERFIEKYAKQIVYFFGISLLAVIGYIVYKMFILEPKNREAFIQYLSADKKLTQGKDSLALGGKSFINPGFLGTYNEFKNTDAGKLSAYSAGVIQFKNGKYQAAYDLFDKFDSSESTLKALKYGAMADCLANLNKGDEAIKNFDKAVSASDDPYVSYYFTRKAGLLALALDKKDIANRYFSSIEKKYADYDEGNSDFYIEMLKH